MMGNAKVALHVIRGGKFIALPLTVLWQYDTVIRVQMAPAAGLFLNISVDVGGQSFLSIGTWNFDAPVIDRIVPPHGGTAGGYSVTLMGNNFGCEQRCLWKSIYGHVVLCGCAVTA